MNPLSVWTFYRRHKRRAALLLSLISLVTAGLYLMVALSWAIFIEPMRSNLMFLSKYSVVQPDLGNELDPTVIAQIRANPDVRQVIPANHDLGIGLPEVMGGEDTWFNLLALMEEDIPYVMERCGATLKEGRLLQPRTNGIMLSEEVAANLGLQVGDTIHNSIDPERYANLVDPMEVVGILGSDVRLGIVSYEFFSSHELYRRVIAHGVLVVAQEGREATVEDFLISEIQTGRTRVWAFQQMTERVARKYQKTYSLAALMAMIVAIAVTLVVSVVNRISFARRLPEFGILHAAGHSKKWLTRRLTIETAALTSIGWVIGIALSWSILYLLKLTLFVPRGHDLNVISLAPAVPAIPIPLSVIGFTLVSVGRIFSRLDPVAVVERRELSLERSQQRRAMTSQTNLRSSPQPLTSWTFFRRHRQRAMLLIGAMGLMIMAIVLVIFVFAATYDAQKASLGNLSRTSIVRSRPGSRLDPGVVAQVGAHPAVERLIPFVQVSVLDVIIPPFGEADVNAYGVYAEDMAYLVALYDLELDEGHLPRPRTNEMIIPQTVAQNRGLEIGDVIGNRDHPVYPGAPNLPTEFVISGIFSRPTAEENENWLCFVSLEFVESHEAFHISDNIVFPLIVVPKAGQKAALDDWLEGELASSEVHVQTYRQQATRAQKESHSMILAMALIESVIAVVAAIALAVLNTIFVSQRQSEFGLLNALGFGRLQLVGRTVRETAFTTGAAWALSAVLCLMGLLYLQFGVFAPLGLRLNLINLTPWLFTLPIPVAVLAATAGTTARTLSKLDPVSIIERR